MKKILVIIGARPQFIKHAPIEIAFQGKAELISIHTGQHYDHNMSQVFFDELGMSAPKYMLAVGSHSHGMQTGKMMIEIESIVLIEKPDAILVYGDTNSTLAGALVGSKLHIPVIHVEAGLRSFNKKMPEEINRILTDNVSEMLFVPTQNAIDNLNKEGISENIYLTGDVMKDMVNIVKDKGILSVSEDAEQYYYATLHRPYNTDTKERLSYILDIFNQLLFPVKFPAHPRTRHKMKSFGLIENDYPNVIFCEPFAYFENMQQLANARALITDSGGMQKEAYWMQKNAPPSERKLNGPETLKGGCNTLLFNDLAELGNILEKKEVRWDDNLYGNGEGAKEIAALVLAKI